MTFEEKIAAAFGEQGERWLEKLPQLIRKVECEHGLHSIQPFSNLSYNYVARAIKEGQEVVVKIGLPGYDFTNQVRALEAFDQTIIAALLVSNVEEGYYIMESISPGTTLNAQLPDTRTNVRFFVEQWRRLHNIVPSETIEITLPSIDTWFRALDAEISEVPKSWLVEAKLASSRLKELQQDTNLHGDLHHENILWDDTRGFVIIDPKGVVGHAYYDCVQFLFNKNRSVEEFAQKVTWLIEEHGFEQTKLLDAIKALGMVYLVWAIEDKVPEARERYEMMKWIMERE
ncbi:hypothetical protein CQS04_01960 [Chryseomicrobium excrementi]|uniref:Kinase n=1 Tax=Chryseomicrobium excrementi TaxID=2041346 RepID=A0A2M9F2I1_9BACL|nr:aminoglycoside phosphotransferase family protein [Chryseomicrobium excrementi]PJK17664.1 hypothetical protein CQS04_01960 [Chryseomicrobium excrementi]